MKKVMAVNCGSSSVKFKLYEMPEETVICSGIVERIGHDDAIFTIKYLKMLGIKPCSTPFYQSSQYFRDALVRANYQNLPKEIYHTEEYLKRF